MLFDDFQKTINIAGYFFQTLGFQEKNFRIIENEFTPSLQRSRNAKPSQNRLLRNRVQTLKVKK